MFPKAVSTLFGIVLSKYFVKSFQNNCIVGRAVPVVNQHNCSVVLACTCASKANLLALTMTTDASLSGYRMTLLGRSVKPMVPADVPQVHLRYMVPVPPSNPCRGDIEQGSRPIVQGKPLYRE